MRTVQRQERQALKVTQATQFKDVARQQKALDSLDKREIASLNRDEQRDQHLLARGPGGAMPSLVNLINRETDRSEIPDIRSAFDVAAGSSTGGIPDLAGDFEKASSPNKESRRTGGDGDSPERLRPPRFEDDKPDRSKHRDHDRER